MQQVTCVVLLPNDGSSETAVREDMALEQGLHVVKQNELRDESFYDDVAVTSPRRAVRPPWARRLDGRRWR